MYRPLLGKIPFVCFPFRVLLVESPAPLLDLQVGSTPHELNAMGGFEVNGVVKE